MSNLQQLFHIDTMSIQVTEQISGINTPVKRVHARHIPNKHQQALQATQIGRCQLKTVV